jgi:lysosomal alpha-mannosidase
MLSSIHLPAILIILLGQFITQISSNPFNIKLDQGGCDYANCPAIDANKLNIHLIPHSHDDVGWLKTVDQYYYGSARGDNSGVQYILDSVVQALIAGNDRRFIQVETAFLWKWWKEQNKMTKAIVKDLVKRGKEE